MRFYIIIFIFLSWKYAYNTNLLTHQYVDNNSECLTDELYGDFTDEEFNNLVKRRKNVRRSMNKNLYREELDTLYVPVVFHNLYKTVDGTAMNSYCDFGYGVLLNDQDRCNERMWRSLEVLNAQYKPSGVQFKLHDNHPGMLAATDQEYDGFFEDVIGGNVTTPTPNTIKKHYNIPNTLNIYTHECLPTSDSPCWDTKFGFSTYPWSLDNNEPGIFIKHQSLPGSEDTYPAAASSQVGILAHEISHFFSLLHINGTWFAMQGNTQRELADSSDCDIHGDLICDTPASPGYVVINSDLASYYTNSTTRECIYHGYGGNYDPVTNILKIGGFNKFYDLGSYPNYNYCEEWGFTDPYELDNCKVFTNYDDLGIFFGTKNLPEEACMNDDKSEYATECHINNYSYLPIGKNLMYSGTTTLHYCSPHPIGHNDYDPSNHGFTTEQFSNIRQSIEVDYTACSNEEACNYGLSIRKGIEEESLLRSGESSCLYPCKKQESEEYYEQFHPGCLIAEGYPIDYSQDGCSENLLSLNKNITPQNFGIHHIYPNPFNPITTIHYSLNKNENVEVSIYDIAGRLITTLINEFQIAGYHSITWNASNFSSGIYFLNMSSGETSRTKKLMLIK
ncbi:MAG TPA: zinc-dependent metalloprotease [Candidatus Marinimicrobia bacterium]|nr:zinc-dependent metalloprotease [Candidatus Neomarinimicrobiota bacterium]